MNTITRKKPFFPMTRNMRDYLKKYNRYLRLPVNYFDLLRTIDSYPLLDKKGNDTLWECAIYDQETMKELNHGLTMIYALLKTAGDMSVMEHLYTERIDYCTFGNSNPFRVRIVNQLNDNYDYFYVKKADVSRIYGLELEHILSPNRFNFLVDGDTLIEEHIAGVPGDQFMIDYMSGPHFNKVRIAKEFVKFNERCFVRLLGDMRSYNYVVDITPDFEDEQYRIRAIDFDQQSYEGRKTLYLPQFFKENNPIIKIGLEVMTRETTKQYRHEELTLLARRAYSARFRLGDLLDTMERDTISTRENVKQLAAELADHHKNPAFRHCTKMGQLVRLNIQTILNNPLP